MKKPPTATSDPLARTEAWARGVLDGSIITGRLARLAVERARRDHEDGPARGLRFDPDWAAHAIRSFSFLRHSKGEWAGQAVTLSPWQEWRVSQVFGWRRADGTRRFRKAYTEVARKNGKSTEAAGIAIYLADADAEPGAEVYCAATKREQAKLVFEESRRMVRQSPALRKRFRSLRDCLSVAKTNSKVVPLGRDSDSTDGLNPHAVVADEVHKWRGREFWDVLDTATGARRQPLLWAITTAGGARTSLCGQLHEYAEKVLNGLVQDDSFFASIFAIDDDDDPMDESCWIKANPNLGISCKLDKLREAAAMAREDPASMGSFLRLHLGRWGHAEARWLDPDQWRACGAVPVDAESLRGRPCYAGLDLSAKLDLTALALVFPPVEPVEPVKGLLYLWCPADTMARRIRRDRVPYDAWARAGLLTPTPGNAVDYDAVLATVLQLAGAYQIQELAFDPWNAMQFAQRVQASGVPAVEFRQGFKSMTEPTGQLEVLVVQRGIAHGGNPAWAWMADNAVLDRDAAGGMKVSKRRSIEKVDGIVALVMALGRMLVARPCATPTVDF